MDSPICRNDIMNIFNISFDDYISRGIISESDITNHSLCEDFIILNFQILEKGKPFIFIDPGELIPGNKTNPDGGCWNFIYNARIMNMLENEKYNEEDDDEEDNI